MPGGRRLTLAAAARQPLDPQPLTDTTYAVLEVPTI